MSNPQTCPCGSDTFLVTATVPIPVRVRPSQATILIDRVLGSITRVDARCARCGQTSEDALPSPLGIARGAALTALAQARITLPPPHPHPAVSISVAHSEPKPRRDLQGCLDNP